MDTNTTARLPKSRHDITETRWNMQQSREDAMERNWQKRSELNNLANLFGV